MVMCPLSNQLSSALMQSCSCAISWLHVACLVTGTFILLVLLSVSETSMTSDISAYLLVPKVGANVGGMVSGTVDGMMGSMVDSTTGGMVNSMMGGPVGGTVGSGTVEGIVSDKVGGAVAEENNGIGNWHVEPVIDIMRS